MSVIASILVNRCDGCNDIAVIQTADDMSLFETRWYTGFDVDFCGDCKGKLEHAAAIEQAEADIDNMRIAVTDKALAGGH